MIFFIVVGWSANEGRGTRGCRCCKDYSWCSQM